MADAEVDLMVDHIKMVFLLAEAVEEDMVVMEVMQDITILVSN